MSKEQLFTVDIDIYSIESLKLWLEDFKEYTDISLEEKKWEPMVNIIIKSDSPEVDFSEFMNYVLSL